MRQARQDETKAGVFAPLSIVTFRNVWAASLASNTGALIQGVASAWVMASIASPKMVALVQTATFLPLALIAVPAGAVADMYDRRKAQLAALAVAITGALLMTLSSIFGLITPWSLLGFCFFVGCGVALFSPAWQSSAGEQVPPALLPRAVALNGISYNVARSFGPALGGIIVATLGATAAFALNCVCYFPMVAALLMWRRVPVPSRLPPERLHRAMMAGMRYIAHMQPVRTAIARSLVTGVLGASFLSLMPLVARDELGGGAQVFGILLAVFGMGAVTAIFVLERTRVFGNDRVVGGCSVVLAVSVAAISMSRHLIFSAPFLFLAGAAWMIQVTTVSIAVQLFVPRWVVGRTLASLNATLAGGIALGAMLWGNVAQAYGVAPALLVAATALAVAPLLGIFLPVANRDRAAAQLDEELAEPEVRMAITGRSGPIIVELGYRVPADRARDFYDVMRQVQRIRARNGAYDWSLSRNINDPDQWVERYRSPTWHDYLRQRMRSTKEEMAIQRHAATFLADGAKINVERWLERPFGSVRWRADSQDLGSETVTEAMDAGPAKPGGAELSPAPRQRHGT